jgi:hypothetical protein
VPSSLHHHLHQNLLLKIKSMKNLLIIIITLVSFSAFAQVNPQEKSQSEVVGFKNRLSFPVIILPNLWEENDRLNTKHIELHYKRKITSKDIVGIKFATWRLFQPMGIVWWDGLLDKIDSGSEFYPGYLRETGLGISYQRMLWKGLFATLEVLPQYKTYLDEDKNKVGDGFKLYNSIHLGYHIAFGKNKRFFIEPQVHCQNWLIDTKAPEEFKALDDKWRNYFLFEPNLYFGVNF